MDLHHIRRGSGEPLLLIQGMSGNHLHWGEPFLSALERDFDLVAFDNRGVGRSPRAEEPFTIADLATDALGVMDAEGWHDAHVLGISMGGMIAQELTLRAPERVRSLALGCTYCGGEGSALAEPAVIAALTAALQSGDTDRAIRTGFEVNVSAGFAAVEENFATFRDVALQLPAPVPVTMLQMQAVMGHDTRGRLHEIGAPTLVVHGDEDRMLPVANGRLIASLIPGARLEVLPATGHLFWWEHPQRSAELIRSHALAGAAAQ